MADPRGDDPAIAIIPARGGSKRIPRKNIRPFLGVPLVARTIGILVDARIFDRIVVSTDDEEIAAVSIEVGAEVPFSRPADLADDHTPTAPVVADAIERLGELNSSSNVCCVYPAAVFATAVSLVRAREQLALPGTDFVVPVSRFPAPIERALRVGADGRCSMVQPEHRSTRTQDLGEAYHDAGQFYWGRTEAWLAQSPIFGAKTRCLILPPWQVQDIDTEDDWVMAEHRFRALMSGDTA